MSDIPQAVIPFVIDRAAAETSLSRWAEGLWFVPRKVRRLRTLEDLRPVFVPYRVFEADTVSHYKGRRGKYYWVERETKDPHSRSHEVRETSWKRAQGTLRRHFGDVVVCAATQPSGAEKLDSWLLNKVVPYTPEAVGGVEVVAVDTGLEEGWERAEQVMARIIEEACMKEIGGDEQRVDTLESTLSERVHTLALMPVWAGSYRFRGRVWPVVVNGRTGHVEGEHPYSKVKLATAFAALIALAELTREMFFG